ncbi:MAG: hypothetical protein FWF76_02670 [Oscillospiraceae bacterium]|nr:hypothetical protein [Oscillospiraceae bacterium]
MRASNNAVSVAATGVRQSSNIADGVRVASRNANNATPSGVVRASNATPTPNSGRAISSGTSGGANTGVGSAPVNRASQNASPRVHDVINETVDAAMNNNGNPNITSRHTLSSSEAIDLGIEALGPGYREIGRKGSGVFENTVGEFTYRFRMDVNSLLGRHAPAVPHVHLEILDTSRNVLANNHVRFIN